jgi:kumamolisin
VDVRRAEQPIFLRPAWQIGAGVPTGAFRLIPDVALVADPNTGAYLVLDGQVYVVGGTSWSALS